jgi:phosphoribosylglycinamide formyltransferase-1
MLSVLVLISGSGSNLLALLKAAEHPLFPAKILAVGSDKPASGLAHADLYGVPTFVVEPAKFSDTQSWAKKLEENISHYNPDLIVLAGFMKILPSSFVHTFSPRIINIHPSLLPSFPGAHAVRDALASGAKETGTTIHIVDEGVDTGPILGQKSLAVLPSDDEASLHERIKVLERKLLVETIQSLALKQLDPVTAR